MSGVTIRAATASDAEAIQSMLEDLARQDGAEMLGNAASLVAIGFGARPLFHVLLAENDRGILGLVLFYPEVSTLRGAAGVCVQDLYVAPDARGMGLGPELLRRAAAAGDDWGARYLTLMVDHGNTAARRFYARQGFAPRGDYLHLILEGADLAALRNGAA